ncbi:MAG: GAF domain-containing protein, partial [Actinomycetota bacterium]
MKLPIPANEQDRLAAVEGLRILETAPEPEFDELAHLAARICGAPIAQINLVTSNHAWAKANIGFPDRNTKRTLTVCGFVVGAGQPIVIPDTHQDERSSLLPMVVQGPKIRFYAGVPLILKGRTTVGTLCVMDTSIRSIELEQLGALQTLARQVVAHLE